jgi:pyrroline-5-carboxylate reductase
MPATLGVVGAEGALTLARGRARSSQSVSLILFASSGFADAEGVGGTGSTVATSFRELATSSEVILVAPEPADILSTLADLAPHLGEDHVVVVASTGITLDRLRPVLGRGPALLRAVLGPDGMAGGVLAVSPEGGTGTEAVERAVRALAWMGLVEVLPEESLEAARALIEASKDCLVAALAGMEDGAVEAGLPRDVARSLARQTGLATALLLQDHPGSPADLKDQVASPGGTTIAGLAVLEGVGVRGAFMGAVEAAAVRAREARDADQSHVVE